MNTKRNTYSEDLIVGLWKVRHRDGGKYRDWLRQQVRYERQRRSR